MKFEYQALDHNNKIVRDVVEAKNFEDFLKIMYKKRLYPIEVKKLSKVNVKTYGDLERLKKLRNRIENADSEEIEERVLERPAPIPRKQFNIDYSYLLYLLLIIGLITAAVLSEIQDNVPQ